MIRIDIGLRAENDEVIKIEATLYVNERDVAELLCTWINTLKKLSKEQLIEVSRHGIISIVLTGGFKEVYLRLNMLACLIDGELWAPTVDELYEGEYTIEDMVASLSGKLK